MMTVEKSDPMERRLVLRVLEYWRSISTNDSFPARDRIDPSKIPDLWPHCILVDAAGKEADPEIVYVGEGFEDAAAGDLTRKRISELPSNVLASEALSFLFEVLDKRAPVSRGGQFLDCHGTHILFRSIILPLANDGATIDGLLCAANCRKVLQE